VARPVNSGSCQVSLSMASDYSDAAAPPSPTGYSHSCSVLFCKFYIRWRPIKASDELVGELIACRWTQARIIDVLW
jgi:hypothetical protein